MTSQPELFLNDFSKYECRPLVILLKNSLSTEDYERRFKRLGRLYEQSEKAVYELGKFSSGMGYVAIMSTLTDIFGKKVTALHTLKSASPFERTGWMRPDHEYRYVLMEVLNNCITSTMDDLLKKKFPSDKFDLLLIKRMDEMFGLKYGSVYDYRAPAKDRVLLDLARLLHKNFEADLKVGDITKSIWEKIVHGYARLLYLYFISSLAKYHDDNANLLESLVDISFKTIPVGHYRDHWTVMVKK